MSEVARAEGAPSVQKIEDFVSDIRHQVRRGNFGHDRKSEVGVKDLSSEENLGGVNPLPVNCPLCLVDLGEVNSYLNSVIQEARGGGNMRYGVVSNEIRTLGEASAASSSGSGEANIRPPVRGDGLNTGAGLDTGDLIIVNLSKKHFTEVEVSLSSMYERI